MTSPKVCYQCQSPLEAQQEVCPHCGHKQDAGPNPGDRIGKHYNVEGIIGQGGMGRVYKATHDLTGQVVAIKTLSPHLASDPGLRERFLQEARALAAFDHPNIMTLHTFLEEAGQFFLVMQFIDGQDLDAMFRRFGGLSVRATVPIFVQALDGLHYAHQRGVIHRDLKPANIMVTRDGRVKLTDFGIARIHGELRLTVAGAQVGTVFYMAPEQIQGTTAEPRTDIYAMGVSLFEVLTGRLPFEGDDYIVRKGHVEQQPPDPRHYRPEVPPSLVQVIFRALAKNPADRFQTAEEFQLALPDFGDPLPLIPCPYCNYLHPEGEGATCPSCHNAELCKHHMVLSHSVCQRCFHQMSEHPTLQDKTFRELETQKPPAPQAHSNPQVVPSSFRLEKKSSHHIPIVQETPAPPQSADSPPASAERTQSHDQLVATGAPRAPRAPRSPNAPPSKRPVQSNPSLPSTRAASVGHPMPIAAQRNSSPSSLLTIDGAEMILIPEGKFLLGSPNGDTDTQPMRECFLPAYYIDRYPVTNERYLQFIKNAGHPPPAHWWNPKEHGGQFFAPEKAHHPVTNIHYQDAIQYCEWSGKRLPTEAEWEKAARTSDGRAYPWGIHWQKGIANFGTHQTTPVYAFPEGQSPYGAYDLLGNTWEWVTDWYSAETYQHINPTTPHGPQQGTHRVIRGGSYADPPSSISSYTRGYRDPLLASPTLGFRCALHSPNSSRKNL